MRDRRMVRIQEERTAMIYGQDRNELRQMYAEAWKKQCDGLPLSPLEAQIADVVGRRTVSAPIKNFSREIPWSDDAKVLDELGSKVYIKHLDGPLFFGFASRFQEMIRALPDIQVVVMRMEKVPYVDQSGMYAMEDAIMELQEQGIEVVFSGLHGQPLEMFKLVRVITGLVSEEKSFETFDDCAKWLYDELGSTEVPVAS